MTFAVVLILVHIFELVVSDILNVNKKWIPTVKKTPDILETYGLPLKTESRWIVSSKTGKRIKLACVNWYGAEEMDFVVSGLNLNSVKNISVLIAKYGFNCVRLPFSNELVEKNPSITNTTIIEKNMHLYGKSALEVLDEIIGVLESNNILVILDNHASDANWCCSDNDGNGLWYNARYSEEQWINDWVTIVKRYISYPSVIGVDLRNELRKSCGDFGNGYNECREPDWGSDNHQTDWKLAAEKVAKSILQVNPNLLIIVEGLKYSLDFTGVYRDPIVTLKGNLVYEPHDYSWSQITLSCGDLHKKLGDNWGFILEEGKEYTAPIWVGEFGTCHTKEDCIRGDFGTSGFWYDCFLKYLKAADIDWSYWALDGTEARGSGRHFGEEETFGILNKMWNNYAMKDLLSSLQQIQNKTQGP